MPVSPRQRSKVVRKPFHQRSRQQPAASRQRGTARSIVREFDERSRSGVRLVAVLLAPRRGSETMPYCKRLYSFIRPTISLEIPEHVQAADIGEGPIFNQNSVSRQGKFTCRRNGGVAHAKCAICRYRTHPKRDPGLYNNRNPGNVEHVEDTG